MTGSEEIVVQNLTKQYKKVGAVVLIGYALVTGVIGTAIMRRRDIS